MKNTRIVVGLGNPGAKYLMNRHNVGFMVIDRLANRWGVTLREESRFSGWLGKGKVGDETVYLLKPTTYMNDSGIAVRKVIDYYKLDAEAVIVATDDVALPFSQLRIRESGSAGGHNGLKSIQQHLGTNKYLRLRMGIGSAENKEMVDHVLGNFSTTEKSQLLDLVDNAGDVIERLCVKETSLVMNDVNRRAGKKCQQQPPTAGQENKHDDKDKNSAV